MTQNGHNKIPLNVPILGGPKKLGRGKAGVQVGALPRKLDENGLMETVVVQGPDGRPMPSLQRESYMDAEQLLSAIEEIVERVVWEVLRKQDA